MNNDNTTELRPIEAEPTIVVDGIKYTVDDVRELVKANNEDDANELYWFRRGYFSVSGGSIDSLLDEGYTADKLSRDTNVPVEAVEDAFECLPIKGEYALRLECFNAIEFGEHPILPYNSVKLTDDDIEVLKKHYTSPAVLRETLGIEPHDVGRVYSGKAVSKEAYAKLKEEAQLLKGGE